MNRPGLALLGVLSGGAVLAAVAFVVTADASLSPSVDRVATCRADLVAEYERWRKHPEVAINPPSCDQPGVTYDQYVDAWHSVTGGDVWVADPTPTRREM